MIMRNVVVLAAMLALGCSQPSPMNGSGDGSTDRPYALTGDEKADWDGILRIEAEAKALAKTDGCSSAGQCRTAPVGSRACGGPRYYLVYCARTTDSAALFRKLDAVADAERAYNVRYQIVSTCEFRMPPTVALIGGMCAAQTSGRNNP